ncbi:MAG: PorT family protein [Flavobacteriaceae bacterium]|nr:PorT family protein [Flavobacteriaceae bacterium]
MKKVFLTAVVAVMTVVSMNAQTSFGVKAGVNFADIKGDFENNSSLTSFHIGGVVEFKLSDKFSLQPELLFSAQGTKLEESEDVYSYESKIKFNYLNIPVIAKYYVMEGLSLEFGPQLGILLSADVDSTISINGKVDETDKMDVKEFIEDIDFGVNFGASYQLENNLFFQARYNLGLVNVSKDSDDAEMKNSVFQLSVGYKFN